MNVRGKLSKNSSMASNGGHKALRASAISAFVNMVHEARLMRLDARKMHLGAAFYAIYFLVQPLGFAFIIWHNPTIKIECFHN
jgi:hypothetical protein